MPFRGGVIYCTGGLVLPLQIYAGIALAATQLDKL